MRVKINEKYYYLTDEELEFVRSQIGEWEVGEYKFERPVHIPISGIALAKKISVQAVHDFIKRHKIDSYLIGNTRFVTFEDALKYWFRALSK